jgi:hypothetical protein
VGDKPTRIPNSILIAYSKCTEREVAIDTSSATAAEFEGVEEQRLAA